MRSIYLFTFNICSSIMLYMLSVVPCNSFCCSGFVLRFVDCLLCLFQALIALKKGAQLLKYGRKGKPKFCPFRLSNVSFILKPLSWLLLDVHAFIVAWSWIYFFIIKKKCERYIMPNSYDTASGESVM